MNKIFFIFLLLVSFGAFGKKPTNQEQSQLKQPEAAQFEIEKGLLNKIYNESKTSETVIASHPLMVGITLTPQLSLASADQMTLSNKYFDVVYSEALKGVPGITLSFSNPLTHLGGLQLSLLGSFGYSFKELAVDAESKTGGVFRDQVRLHWIPLSLGIRTEYEIPGFTFVKPFLNAGLGIQWLYQTGKLDGIEQGFWVSFYQLGGGLTFFSGERNSSNWFGGINLGLNLNQSLGSSQTVKNTRFDLGVNFIL